LRDRVCMSFDKSIIYGKEEEEEAITWKTNFWKEKIHKLIKIINMRKWTRAVHIHIYLLA
jgi:hypothetical protein